MYNPNRQWLYRNRKVPCYWCGSKNKASKMDRLDGEWIMDKCKRERTPMYQQVFECQNCYIRNINKRHLRSTPIVFDPLGFAIPLLLHGRRRRHERMWYYAKALIRGREDLSHLDYDFTDDCIKTARLWAEYAKEKGIYVKRSRK